MKGTKISILGQIQGHVRMERNVFAHLNNSRNKKKCVSSTNKVLKIVVTQINQIRFKTINAFNSPSCILPG